MEEKNKKESNGVSLTVKNLLKIGAVIGLSVSLVVAFSVALFLVVYMINYSAINSEIVASIMDSEADFGNIDLRVLVDSFIFTGASLIILFSLLSIYASYKILSNYIKIDKSDELSEKMFFLILIAIVYAFATPWLISSILIVSAVVLNETNGVNKQGRIAKKIKVLNGLLEEGEISEIHYKEELEKLINKL